MNPDMRGRGLYDPKVLKQDILKDERDRKDEFSKDAFVSSFLSEVAGGIGQAGGIANAATKVAPTAAQTISTLAKTRPIATAGGIGAIQGGIYGAGTGEGGFEERAPKAAGGAFLGGAFGAGGGALASRFSKAPAANAGDDALSSISKQFDDVADGSRGISRNLNKADDIDFSKFTPDEAKRYDILKSVGIDKPTAAMISRDPKLWQFERNTAGIQGVGDDIRQRYVQSNEAIQKALNKLAKDTGGKASIKYEAGASALEAVSKKSNEMQKEVSRIYDSIRKDVGDDIGLKPAKILNALDEAADNAYADSLVSSVQRKMRRYGLLDSDFMPVDDKTLTVKNAEELRKFVNNLKSGDPKIDRIADDVINALDDDVVETVGNDAFKIARDAARNRFKEFETKTLNNITKNKLVADDFMKRAVFGGKVNDLQSIKNTLTTGTENQISRGVQAWNDIKLQTMDEIITKSGTPTVDGYSKIMGSRLSKQLDKIGKEKLSIIFTPDELVQLNAIKEAAEFTTVEVPESFVNYSGTGAAFANIIKNSKIAGFLETTSDALGQVPVIGGLASPLRGTAEQISKGLRSQAARQSVKRSLDPLIKTKSANPLAVIAAGQTGGQLPNKGE